MTTDPPGPTDPFAAQTQTNTGSTEWLDGYKTIKADFGSLNGYAMNMYSASMDLLPASMPLYKIPELTNQAFRNENPFPEGQLAALFVGTNFKDLVAMLTDLHVGLQNMAYAAQTISDSYHLNDDGSSKDLNSLITVDGVDFAFGRGGVRPDGLDKKIGKTWLESAPTINEAQANAAVVTNAADPGQMGGTITVTYIGPPDHQTKVTTITYADGSSIQMEQTTGWNGESWTTTSVLGSDGKVQTSSRQIKTESGGSTTVVTQTQDKNGNYQDAAKQVTTTSYSSSGAKVTTTDNSTIADGKWTASGTKTQTDNADGSTQTTTTTVSTGPDGKTTARSSTVAVGNNDGDVSDQSGDLDPKHEADHRYTTFTHQEFK